MKIKIFVILFLLLNINNIKAIEINVQFPDSGLQAEVAKLITGDYSNTDHNMTTSEINGVRVFRTTTVDAISDLSGLEIFTNLMILDIYNQSSLTSFSDRFLNGTYNLLNQMSISGSNLESINSNTFILLFASMPNLSVLSLEYNNLNAFPAGLSSLNLGQITLKRNNIREIPLEFKELDGFYSIDLDYNQLNSIENINYNDYIETISISHNLITRIPEDVIYCTNLIVFLADHNRIDYIDPLFRIPTRDSVLAPNGQTYNNVPRLNLIDLSYNNISELPESFRNFRTIISDPDSLRLYHNKITNLSLEDYYLFTDSFYYTTSTSQDLVRSNFICGQSNSIKYNDILLDNDFVVNDLGFLNIISSEGIAVEVSLVNPNGDITLVNIFEDNSGNTLSCLSDIEETRSMSNRDLFRDSNDIILDNGILTINKALLNNIGSYKVLINVVDKVSFLKDSTYELLFNVKTDVIDNPTLDNASDDYDNSIESTKVPKTGCYNPLLISLSLSLLFFITYIFIKKEDDLL